MLAENNTDRLATSKEFGSLYMYLPCEVIDEKLKQYGIKYTANAAGVPIIPFDHTVPLTTKILDSDGKEITVIFNGHKHLKRKDTNEVVGTITFDDAGSAIFPNHLYIKSLGNTSGYKHVGNALLEVAFRMSLSEGCKGKTWCDAYLDSHAFYYKYGYRFSSTRFPSIADEKTIKEIMGLVAEYKKYQTECEAISATVAVNLKPA